MSKINEGQVELRKGNAVYSYLNDYLDGREVYDLPFIEDGALSFAAAQHALIDTDELSGVIAKDATSVTNNGIIAAALVGAVGTAAITSIADSNGNFLNSVEVRDALTHEPLKEGNKDIFGLIQCSSTVTDGDAIGAPAAENLQISLVYYATDGTVTLATALTASVEFHVAKLITRRNKPTIIRMGGNARAAVIDSNLNRSKRFFAVTTAFEANEVITFSSGAGASSGASTATGNTVTLHTSAALFNNDNECLVKYNGVEQIKGSGKDFVWDSTTTGHFTFALDVGDDLSIELPIK